NEGLLTGHYLLSCAQDYYHKDAELAAKRREAAGLHESGNIPAYKAARAEIEKLEAEQKELERSRKPLTIIELKGRIRDVSFSPSASSEPQKPLNVSHKHLPGVQGLVPTPVYNAVVMLLGTAIALSLTVLSVHYGELVLGRTRVLARLRHALRRPDLK